MKRLILILIFFLCSFAGFGQLYYTPITEGNIRKKGKMYYVNKIGDMHTIKMNKKLRYLMKDVPCKPLADQPYVIPNHYLVTRKNIYILTPDNLLIMSRKGRVLKNLKEPAKALFDSTSYSRYEISTAQGGDCKGNAGRGIFVVPCREYVFYVSGQKLICMNRKFEIEEEFYFKDFKNKGKYPLVHYFFESVDFRVDIKGQFK